MRLCLYCLGIAPDSIICGSSLVLSLPSRSVIEECLDGDPEKMKAKVSYVKLDTLGNMVGKKASLSNTST